ncbi:hypothetical protein DFH06DRAFT_1129795 [Mycena polygramma]|nr:hypothetical protein DFH06DRAFT_1129795 [Mycena polygramma]
MAWCSNSSSEDGTIAGADGIGGDGDVMSVPDIRPNPDVVHKFWKRVAELTTRYHDANNNWVGGSEIRKWNNDNRTACRKCVRSKSQRQCIIDEDYPSCRSCRSAKVGCDRKTQFIFDLTKNEFFPVYDQFIKVYDDKEPGHMRKLKQAENTFRSTTRSKDAANTKRGRNRLRTAAREHTSLEASPTSDTISRLSDLHTRLQIATAALEGSMAREEENRRRETQLLANSCEATLRASDYNAGVLSASIANSTRDLRTYIGRLNNGEEPVGPIASTALRVATKMAEDLSTIGDSIRLTNPPVLYTISQ